MNNDPNYFLQSVYGDFNDLTNDNSGYGVLPAVEQTQTYIAYFNSVGSTGPELIDQTGYFIKYIVDSNGNVSKPAPGNTSLINLKDNFELGKTIVVESKDATQALATLLGEHTVTEIGTITPLLITETGSQPLNYISTMSFAQEGAFILTGTIPDYTFKAKPDYTQTIYSPSPLIFLPPSKLPSSTAATWTYNSRYVLSSTTSDYGSPLSISLNDFQVRNLTNTSTTLNISVRKNGIALNYLALASANAYYYNPSNGSKVASPSYINTDANTLVALMPPTSTNIYINLKTDFQNFDNGDYIEIFVESGDGVTPITVQYAAGYMSVDSIYNSNEMNVSAPYWSGATYPTDNKTPQWITASLSMSGFLNNNMIQITPTASLSMSFSQIIYPANIQPGDNIRFEYTPTKQSKIYEVDTLDDGRIAFKIFPAIPTGSKLDHFVIWRTVDDGNYITLDVKKQASGQIAGWLKPKYMSKELKDNFTNIINKLEADGLLA